MSKALKVENPAVLPLKDKIRITFDGLSSEWVIIRSKNSAWLLPSGRYPLDNVSPLSFRLTIDNLEDYSLEVSREPAT
jgi:hypothetical protein